MTADHGWQLGEHAEWGKHTNWELALQVPLLIRAPWLPASMGKHTGSYFELIDLYRTVASLAGIDPAAIAADVDGSDASKLLADPATTLKTEAYSQYSRCPGDRFWRSGSRRRGVRVEQLRGARAQHHVDGVQRARRPDGMV